MKKIIALITILLIIFILIIIGINEHINNSIPNVIAVNDNFTLISTLNDKKHIYSNFNIQYKNNSLEIALSKKQITIEEFINTLKLIDTFNEGRSKLYKYNKKDKIFGKNNFYVLECNSLDNITNIFISSKKKLLYKKCNLYNINKLENVSMKIKERTLTRSGAIIIITDTSNNNNFYDRYYNLEIKDKDTWKPLKQTGDNMYFSDKLKVDDNNKLELTIYWEPKYGKLENGNYRIIKTVTNTNDEYIHYISTEFTIE